MNKIVIKSNTFYNDAIYSGNLVLVESITGDKLQYDNIDITVNHIDTLDFMPLDADSLTTADDAIFLVSNEPVNWEYGNPIYYYHKDELIGKFYVESVKRVGKTAYNVKGISGVGLLVNSQHYGGIYFGVKMADLVEEIIGGKIKYSIDPMIANQLLYGWLPIATRRENLHQVLFAMGASVKKDNDGEVFITSLSNDTATEIPDSRIYEGGTIEYPQAFTKVALSEHAYIERADDETVTLYDGEISADTITTPAGAVVSGGLILFDAPAHDLVATGTTIIESGVNYAVISPSAECQLVGQKYTHTVRQITRPETEADDETTENKVVVSEATLVSVANSENVAERLADYYDTAKTVRMDIAVNAEHAGDAVTFNDPFDEKAAGLISSMDISISNVLKANAEIIVDYSPTSAGNYYKNVAVITENGTWTVPEEVEKIRLVLIGGGQGGWSGYKGDNGVSTTGYGAGGAGGDVGAGGKGGRIYVSTLEVKAATQYAITIGTGGAGGICTGTGTFEGAEGTATTFGGYSSASGTSSSIGFTEIFEGVNYGGTGLAGEAKGANGGKAAKGDDLIYDGVTYTGGAAGTKDTKTGTSQKITYYAGGGGGAAACANGGDGNKRAGGGAGANATLVGADAVIAGTGGQGGCGGGGGGGSGYEKSVNTNGDTSLNWSWKGEGGEGGLGSAGGKGANGCVIIYY